MSKDVTKCVICGRTLPTFSKSMTCGVTCRKRKSRLGLDAGKNMMAARNAIRYVIKGLELDEIKTIDAYEEYRELVDLVEKLRQAYNDRYNREKTQESAAEG
jgi:hypothetical protein